MNRYVAGWALLEELHEIVCPLLIFLGITQKAHGREVAVIGLIRKVAGGGKSALNHDQVVGLERGHDHEVRDRLLVGKASVDFLRPHAEAWLTVQRKGAV